MTELDADGFAELEHAKRKANGVIDDFLSVNGDDVDHIRAAIRLVRDEWPAKKVPAEQESHHNWNVIVDKYERAVEEHERAKREAKERLALILDYHGNRSWRDEPEQNRDTVLACIEVLHYDLLTWAWAGREGHPSDITRSERRP
jgi:hypothetical protein